MFSFFIEQSQKLSDSVKGRAEIYVNGQIIRCNFDSKGDVEIYEKNKLIKKFSQQGVGYH